MKKEIASEHYVVGKVESIIIDDTNKEVHTSELVFSPQSRTHWHSHPTTQIIIGKSGFGFVQSVGHPPIEIYPGNTIVIPPNDVHCHVAGITSSFTHIVIQVSNDIGIVQRPLTQEEYDSITKK